MVGASRTETLAARQVDDIVEWTKILWCKSMHDFVDENGNLVLNSLRHVQPVKADKRVGDVVGSTQMMSDDMSVAQPRSALTAVDGPGRPEDRPARCCHNPDNVDMLAKHQRL